MNIFDAFARIANWTTDEEIDLCDFPLLLDTEALATFFEQCSKEFPGRKEVCLPLAMAGIVERSRPPVSEALRLLRMTGKGRRAVLTNRLLPEKTLQLCSLEKILFD